MSREGTSHWRPTTVAGMTAVAVVVGIAYRSSSMKAQTIGTPGKPLILRHEATDKLLSFSPENGLFQAFNVSSKPARFRFVPISRELVFTLRAQALDFESRSIKVGLQGVKSKTRSGCGCSGFSNEHGYGRYCHNWEDATQDPWCYVNASCGIAKMIAKNMLASKLPQKYASSASSSSGVPPAVAPISAKKAELMKEKRLAGRPGTWNRRQGRPAPATKRALTLELDTSDAQLMKKLDRFHPKYVALLHDDTQSYLSVERPPHQHALLAHALSPQLSIESIFAVVRPPKSIERNPKRRQGAAYLKKFRKDAYLISLGVNAYLTLCPDHSPSDTGGSAGADRFEGATLCAGHRAEKRWGEPMKLLRRPSVGAAPAIFSMDEIHTPRFK